MDPASVYGLIGHSDLRNGDGGTRLFKLYKPFSSTLMIPAFALTKVGNVDDILHAPYTWYYNINIMVRSIDYTTLIPA